jgi:hypothetical protein
MWGDKFRHLTRRRSSPPSDDTLKFVDPTAGDTVDMGDGTRFKFDGSNWLPVESDMDESPDLDALGREELASLERERNDIASAGVEAAHRGDALESQWKAAELKDVERRIAQLKRDLTLAGGRRRRKQGRTRKRKRKPKTRGRRRGRGRRGGGTRKRT